jgi:hypothetical protein
VESRQVIDEEKKSAVYLVFLYQKEKKKYGRNGTINLAGHIKASSSHPAQMRQPYYEGTFKSRILL